MSIMSGINELTDFNLVYVHDGCNMTISLYAKSPKHAQRISQRTLAETCPTKSIHYKIFDGHGNIVRKGIAGKCIDHTTEINRNNLRFARKMVKATETRDYDFFFADANFNEMTLKEYDAKIADILDDYATAADNAGAERRAMEDIIDAKYYGEMD